MLQIMGGAVVSGSSRFKPWPGALPLQIGNRIYTKMQV